MKLKFSFATSLRAMGRMVGATLGATVLLFSLASCTNDDETEPEPKPFPDGTTEVTSVKGFYLLNQGPWGANKCTLDRYDYASGTYTHDVYTKANPEVVMGLGDNGNDLKAYGESLYAVVNGSNKVEVMNLETCVRRGQVDIPNCRYIAFHDGYAYVTSFAGEMQSDGQIGYVAKVDTATLKIVDKVNVGHQPEGLSVCNGKLYVANSGGYVAPKYDNTLSIIDLATFKEEKRVEVAVNPAMVITDRNGKIWVSAKGDYADIPATLSCYDPEAGKVVTTLEIPVDNMWLHNNSIYTVSPGSWDFNTNGYINRTFAIVNVDNASLVTKDFVKDGASSKIATPYGIGVNPVTGTIYIGDAGDYVNPGTLFTFTKDGVEQGTTRTGDLPVRFVFY